MVVEVVIVPRKLVCSETQVNDVLGKKRWKLSRPELRTKCGKSACAGAAASIGSYSLELAELLERCRLFRGKITSESFCPTCLTCYELMRIV